MNANTNANKVVLAGLAGWALRLAFLSAMAVAAYGVYVAWYGSLGEPDPVHDRITGSVLTGIALGASLVFCFALRSTPRVKDTTRVGWYWFAYLAFFSLFLTALALSAGFRLIGDWERSTLSVTAIVSGCHENASGGNDCTFDWDAAGVHHTQIRGTYGAQYDSGTRVQLWVDPHTGGASNHRIDDVISPFGGAFFSLLFEAYVAFLGVYLTEEAKGWRRWLASLAWWRDLRRVPEDAPTPVEPVIEDAVPPGWADVEDARPPGFEDAH